MKSKLMLTCLLALSLNVAGQNVTPEGWTEIQPNEISVNPIDLFNNWVALSVQDGDKANSMLLTMGQLGVFRGKPVLSIFVNESRYTYELLQRSPYFTVAVFPEQYKENVRYLGQHSGRDGSDKIKDAGLTVSKSELGSPIINEANLVIECRMIYTGTWNEDKLDDSIKQMFYRDGERRPMHQQFIGEIVHVWKK